MKIKFLANELFRRDIRCHAFLFQSRFQFDNWLMGNEMFDFKNSAYILTNAETLNTVYHMEGIRHHIADGGVHQYAYQFHKLRIYKRDNIEISYVLWAVHKSIWMEVP